MSFEAGFTSRLRPFHAGSAHSSSSSSWIRLQLCAVVIALFGLGFWVPGVHAQINAPSCNSSLDFQWAFNSLQQDPCVVTVYLVQPCNPEYSIPAINASDTYNGPTTQQVSPCACSSVTYMMLSACSACQGGGILPWPVYNANCSTIYQDVYPGDIPAATKVPHWAYQNITVTPLFVPSIAELAGDTPESTATSPTSSSTPPPLPTVTPTPTASTSSSSKKSNAGPIAGGVIGGVAVVFVVAIAAMFLRRKQRRRRGAKRKAPSAAVVDMIEDTKPRPYLVPTLNSNTGTRSDFHNSAQVISTPPRFYNPADPSTYPPTMLPSGPPPMHHRPEAGQGHSPQSSENSMYFSAGGGYQSVLPSNRQQMGIPPEL